MVRSLIYIRSLSVIDVGLLAVTISLFAGIEAICKAFPELKVLTSETDPIAPKHFGQKYFGTD